MKIKTIKNPDLEVYKQTIPLLNQIFSAFPDHEEYKVEIAYDLMKNEKDVVNFLAYEDDDELVGLAMCYERTPHFLHLWQFGVVESYRGKGIGQRLYEYVEEYAKDQDYQGVTVNTFNTYPTSLRMAIKRGYKIYDLDKSEKFEHNPKIFLKLTF